MIEVHVYNVEARTNVSRKIMGISELNHNVKDTLNRPVVLMIPIPVIKNILISRIK